MKTIIVDNVNNPTIELDGDQAFVSVGGHDHDGSLLLKNKHGGLLGMLAVQGTSATFQLSEMLPNGTGASAITMHSGTPADVHIGTASGPGNVYLYPGQSGMATLALNGGTASASLGGGGKDGSVHLHNEAGKTMVSVRSAEDKRGGELVVFNEAGAKTITLHGGSAQSAGASIQAFDQKGNSVFSVGSNAIMTIGGPGNNGGLLAYNSDLKAAGVFGCPTGKSFGRVALTNTLSRQVASLTAGGNSDNDIHGHGVLTLSDHDGKATILLDGGNGDIFAGGAGQAGKLVLRDKQGKDTVTLDGATGDVILANADCAEFFDVAEVIEHAPGTVMVLDAHGDLIASTKPYDRKVTGVVSGAGEYRPGLVLDKQGARANRLPIGLLGKVYCKVDAQEVPIEVGDLLTTSATPGHAMKASDPTRAFGAILGKALRPMHSGTGMIPILIALQ